MSVVETLPPIAVDMFRPEGRSRETDAAFNVLVDHFYGPAGQEFAEGLRTGRLHSSSKDEFAERINTHFFNAVKDTYHTSFPMSLYRQSRGVALEVVQEVANKVGLGIARNPLKDEIATPSPRPIDLFYHVARIESLEENPDGRRLGFDARRHFLLLNIAASIEAASGNGVAEEELDSLQTILDDHLYYKGDLGYVETYRTYTLHDADTNRFLAFAGNSHPRIPRENERLLYHEFNARRIERVGLVDSLVRRKDLRSATIKALSKAVRNGGIVKPQYVEDHMGLRLVALEGDVSSTPNTLHSQVDRVSKSVMKAIRRHKRIERVEQDDHVDSERGQGTVIFRRKKLYFKDVAIPLELMVFSEPDFYNQEYEVGVKDSETGLFDGPAHKLYKLGRIADCAGLLLPCNIYRVNHHLGIVTSMEAQVEQLKTMAEVKVSAYFPQQRQAELLAGVCG